MGNAIILFGALLFCCPIWFVWWYLFKGGRQVLAQKRLNKLIEETADSATYTNKTLFLKKRDPELAKIIHIQNDHSAFIAYKPPSYTYTSVTVGNVTTGGVTKTGDYHYSTSMNNGKYKLVYGDQEIHSISIDRSLLPPEQESPIRQYLKNGTSITVVEPKVVNSGDRAVAMMMMNSGNKIGAMNMMMNSLHDGYPSFEKAKAIMDWICSNK